MLQLKLLLKSKKSLERLRKFSKGNNRDYTPISPIWLLKKKLSLNFLIQVQEK